MKKAILFDFVVDKENKNIKVKRSFNAALPLVWQAWTTADILDQWWAPHPYKAETQSMDFREGGRWFYAMVSPDGKEKHWCLMNYKTIVPEKSFTSVDAFAKDESGEINSDFPPNNWETRFSRDNEDTLVDITLSFEKVEHIEQMIQMGFKEGFIGPDDPSCTDEPLQTWTSAVEGNGTYPSGPHLSALAGTYRWSAHYSGDSGNAPAAVGCADAAQTLVLPESAIAVDMTANPPGLPAPGGTFTFAVSVTNTGAVPLLLTSLTDDLHGDLAARKGSTCGPLIGTVLDPDEVSSCTFTGRFTGGPGGVQTNVLTATAVSSFGAVVTDTDETTLTGPPPRHRR